MPKKAAKLDEVDSQQEFLALEGCAPNPEDRDSVAILLKHLFPDDSVVNAGDLAEYITSHDEFGTVVKPAVDDDEDASDDDSDDGEIVFSITSAVDLSPLTAEKHSVVRSIRNFFLNAVRNSESVAIKDKVEELLERDSTCHPYLFINERFDNLSLTVCAEAVSNLPSELKSAGSSPTHFLLMAWAVTEEAEDGTKKYEYAYPEVEFIVPHALYVLEIDPKWLRSNEGKKRKVDEDTLDYDTMFLIIISMDKFQDILDSLADKV
uniref:Protein BCCIP homolog n=1 Tax=Trichobilharzia regenti TaxID=157069 RepID=A0AA85KCZ0_TRIRE|nr:unnamed protein product [Trichobilharzia regenti]